MAIAISAFIIFLAAIVRGYAGFGFSLLTITALSFFYQLQEIIPSIFVLEIAASLHMLPGIWKDIHWKSMMPLILGAAVGTPIGLQLLTSLPTRHMQLALSGFVLLATCLMWRGYSIKSMPGRAASLGVGTASGIANGAFGMSGPIVILFYFASPAGHIAGRASVVFYFLITDIIGITYQSIYGLINWQVFTRAAIFMAPLLLGVWLGTHSFKSADPARFKQIILIFLATIAIATAAKALYS